MSWNVRWIFNVNSLPDRDWWKQNKKNLKWPYVEDCSWLHRSVWFSPPALCIVLSDWTTFVLVVRFSAWPQWVASLLMVTPLPQSEWQTVKKQNKKPKTHIQMNPMHHPLCPFEDQLTFLCLCFSWVIKRDLDFHLCCRANHNKDIGSM